MDRPTKAMVREVMSAFDPLPIQLEMERLNWTWETASGKRVPHLNEIRRAARALCEELCEPGGDLIKCGGFHAAFVGDRIELYFNRRFVAPNYCKTPVAVIPSDEAECAPPQTPEAAAPPRTPEKNDRS